jgi:hypothetical protein
MPSVTPVNNRFSWPLRTPSQAEIGWVVGLPACLSYSGMEERDYCLSGRPAGLDGEQFAAAFRLCVTPLEGRLSWPLRTPS